uniref:Thioredoxin domain-containing protein n=1 Tax=Propithecus coquereli TaxID=379532 RepID=A0A2K6F0H8_PROCO
NEFTTFLEAAGHKLVVVEFSAKWCGPCQRMYPIFHELAESCHIKAIPTFQMFKKNQKGSISTLRSISELHPHQQWAVDSSQASPSRTRANHRTLLKQLGK